MFGESKTVALTVPERPEMGGNGKRLCKCLVAKDLQRRHCRKCPDQYGGIATMTAMTASATTAIMSQSEML